MYWINTLSAQLTVHGLMLTILTVLWRFIYYICDSGQLFLWINTIWQFMRLHAEGEHQQFESYKELPARTFCPSSSCAMLTLEPLSRVTVAEPGKQTFLAQLQAQQADRPYFLRHIHEQSRDRRRANVYSSKYGSNTSLDSPRLFTVGKSG